jgi:multicomponent Na+:H+ antiporter subunit B
VSRSLRLVLFLAAVSILGLLFISGLHGLHPFGDAQGLPAAVYGDTVNRITVPERHITNAVSAVNFDIRAFDTLGEEFILFTSVMAVLLVLRKRPEDGDQQQSDQGQDRKIPGPSDAVRVLTVGLVGPTVLFGVYIVVHGQVTPGGGFQGGVVLATAPLLVYLAGEFKKLLAIAPRTVVEMGEAAGAAGYVLIGVAALFMAAAFLHNYLPLGKSGDVMSGGTVAIIDLAVGLEVAGGFVLLMIEFLEETLERRSRQ